ncbi:TPA: DUF4446 domain-containing protein [Patescibacteria group bacterium]|uniref:DUF4446 domain-containing protein n=1 Tax=Candidatus Gottesmanbacteria bacterium GW2011_GWA1_43_11 TaxID=1618436 RepID=A0A0G1EQY6_9BACT|nr:MAG: hypothetical protein UV59_C0007G0044 [Candidatus Gottesmanbacteria bacterium GW2011_GWA1_43_11]HCS78781.1 DUF4446 domain-containing protein [Patescibacteria group bacterium]
MGELIFLIAGFLWLATLSFVILRAIKNYNELTQGVSDNTLSEVLNKFIAEQKTIRKDHAQVLGEISELKKDSLKFIQKIGLVRFNPFSDTGGDQSFVIALLDNKNSGIVITSLYARTGTRWYVKKIEAGKSIQYELSNEEKEAIKKST